MSLTEVIDHIRAAESAAGRTIGSARLIAVSKMQPLERVRKVRAAGHLLFGENRVQEAVAKWPGLREEFGETDVHLLGPLQSNKTRQAMDLFQAIHSLDRPKLAKAIARLAQESGQCPKLFVQVNTGEEPQKAGVLPSDADAFIEDCRAMDLPVIGLMCIPPATEEAASHFTLLAKLAARNGLPEQSMGMSGDYEIAVAQGATYVRVGSAIFGARD